MTDAKRGPGRPPLPADEKRSVSVLTRWTADELAAIDAAATALGVPRSELIREAAIARARRAVRAAAKGAGR